MTKVYTKFYIAFLVSLLISTIVGIYLYDTIEKGLKERAANNLDEETVMISEVIEQEVLTSFDYLYSTQTFFQEISEITNNDWNRYVTSIKEHRFGESISSIFYVERIKDSDELAAFIQEVESRDNFSASNFPLVTSTDYNVDEPIFVTKFVAPETQGRVRAVGQVVSSDSSSSLYKAIESNSIQLTNFFPYISSEQTVAVAYLPITNEVGEVQGAMAMSFRSHDFGDQLLQRIDLDNLTLEVNTRGIDNELTPVFTNYSRNTNNDQIVATRAISIGGQIWEVTTIADSYYGISDAAKDSRYYSSIGTGAVVFLGVLVLYLVWRDRLKLSDVVEETELRFKSIYNSVDAIICFTEPDGTLIDANKKALTLMDISEKSVNSNDLLTEYPFWKKHKKELDKAIQKVSQGVRKNLIVENQHIAHAENAVFDVILTPIFSPVDKKVQKIVLEAKDITKIKSAEMQIAEQKDELYRLNKVLLSSLDEKEDVLAEVKEEKKRFEIIVESIGQGVILLDRSFNVDLINNIAREMLHLPKDTEDPVDFSMIESSFKTYSEGSPRIVLEEVLSTGLVKRCSKDVWIQNSESDSTPVNLFFSPIKDDFGNVSGVIILVEDVTKKSELEVMRSEFVTLVSHQLRTPLTAIKWYTDLLISTDISDQEKKTYLKEVLYGSDRMSRLIDDLLFLTKIESEDYSDILKKKWVTFSEIVKRVETALSLPLKRKEISLEKDFDDSLKILADTDSFSEVLSNFINNAAKYSEKGSKVTIKAYEEENQTVIQIRDTGIGIPQGEQEIIFEKFYRSENAKHTVPEGNGLGLYLSRLIVQYHGGSISVNSSEGEGTEFTITIPKSDDKVNK